MIKHNLKKTAVEGGLQYTSGPKGSWLSLFNPLSPYMNGGIDRVPKVVQDLFPGNQDAAYMITKMGAMLLLGTALGGTAAITTKAINNLRTGPAWDKSLERNRFLGYTEQTTATENTAEGPQVKTANEGQAAHDRAYDGSEAGVILGAPSILALSVAALLAGGAIGHKRVSSALKEMDKRSQTESITTTTKDLLSIAQLRAANARGQLSNTQADALMQQLQTGGSIPSSYMPKTAKEGDNKTRKKTTVNKLDALLGLPALSVYLSIAGAWLLSHQYFSGQNKDNQAYKQYKKELDAYARERALREPLEMRMPPMPPELQPVPATAPTVRDLPETTEPNKPLALSL